MSIYTDKRSGRLFVQFDYNKQTFKQYLPKGASRLEATKLETKMRSDAFFRANDMLPPEEVRFDDFVLDVYLPWVKTNRSAASFDRADNICTAALPFLRRKSLRAIKPSDIEKFKAWRMELPTQHGRERMPATIARELSVLSKLFRLAIKDRILEFNPCSPVEKPAFDNYQNKVLKLKHEAAFFAAFDGVQGQWAKDICKVVLHTGLRQNDVLGLTKFNVDLDQRLITRLQGKVKRVIVTKLTDDAYEIISRRMAEVKGELLFPSPKTGKRAKSVRSAIRGACKRAGIPMLGIRDLRRTPPTRLHDEGCDVADIAGFLGHKDLRTAPRYMRGTKGMHRTADILQKQSDLTQALPVPKLKLAK